MSCKTERHRAFREAHQQFTVLHARWPQAFPEKSHLFRPLAGGIIPQICQELGWSSPYTRGVLGVWKKRRNYCIAVLCYDTRINLDGSASEQPVSDEARTAAKAQLEELARMKAARIAREAKRAAEASVQEPQQAA